MNNEILVRFFRNLLSPEEAKKVEQWILDSSNKEAVLRFLESEYLTGAETLEVMPFEDVIDRIRQKEDVPGKKVTILRQKWFWAASAACIIFLMGGAWFGYYLNASEHQNTSWKINTAHTGPGQYAKVTLSDGSMVFLAGNTSLSFPEEVQANPVVYLDGEAFFDLENGGANYTIKTKDLVTNTRNSKLNILSSPGDNLVKVIVRSGKASIKGNDGDEADLKNLDEEKGFIEKSVPKTAPLLKLIPALNLKANEQATYDKTTRKTKIVALDPNTAAFMELYPAKIKGQPDSVSGAISFSNSCISEITNRLHKMYNLDFEINLDEKMLAGYTGKFSATENPFNILIVVCNKLGLTYRMEGNVIRITKLPKQ